MKYNVKYVIYPAAFIAIAFIFIISCSRHEPIRSDVLLETGWKFAKGDFQGAEKVNFDDSRWADVTVPHDWAIYGPFDRSNDLQNIAITQNFETEISVKTGRTGGLPYVGTGWYRTSFDVPNFDRNRKSVSVLFDGAMSEAKVYINGHFVIEWPLGYNSFHCDITDYINKNGKDNVLAVRLENPPFSSRWYPGAGLYRNVHIITNNRIHIPVWGTYVTTPEVTSDKAKVMLQISIDNAKTNEVDFMTEILDGAGHQVSYSEEFEIKDDSTAVQTFMIDNPELWSPETPFLYTIRTKVIAEANTIGVLSGTLLDEYSTQFGIRSVEIIPDKGFFLNGVKRKFKGVCNHHDLGPLGAAVNKAAIKRQLTILKDMGCDAIRTSHNMPAPELVQLCDEMGFMMIVESFDEWDIAKCENGYHRFFNQWAEKDMVNMIHHYRNNPSVVMWSIGNEVPTQCDDQGYRVASFLQGICHREDSSRAVTCGMDQVSCVVSNGFAALMDVVGLNYRTFRYQEAYDDLPQKIVLGSETASTVSSRGVYKFPAEPKAGAMYDDHQSSSYDLEYCWWSNIPDEDFALADDYPWTIGQFAWTGFDYLGEPTPYDTDAWPNHSSLFGIVDLASIPKDRYFLYRSIWNEQDNTLHLLPHWNWDGKQGECVPVFCYTNYPSAELFVNGVSQGIKTKNKNSLLERYRLMWPKVIYQPGEIEVVAYDSAGVEQQRAKMVTAGDADHIELSADRLKIAADGKDLVYINVKITDKNGILCPNENKMIKFGVEGDGRFRAAANGDATNTELFHIPQMHTFSGQLTAIVQSSTDRGTIKFTAEADGLKGATIVIKTY